MKRNISILFLSLFSLVTMQAQNPENDQIRIKIDANVNGENVKIDTAIDNLGDFDIDAFLKELGIENELQQLNIDINSGYNFNFNWDEEAFQEIMEGLQNIEMPEMPELPELPDLSGLATIEMNEFNKAFLGVYTDKVAEGAKINKVSEGSAAEEAGLKVGDIITKIDDRTIESPSNLSEVIGIYEPDTKVLVTYIRDGEVQTVSAVLKKNEDLIDWGNIEWPNMDSFKFQMDELDFENMMKENDHGFLGVYLDDEKGEVLINGIEEKSAAEVAGLKSGDILKEINGQKVATYDDVVKIMHETKPGDKVTITYMRDGKQMKTDAVLKENKSKYFYWNSSDSAYNGEGFAPDMHLKFNTPCLPGSVYTYNSTDGKKNVNVCITVVTKDNANAPSPTNKSAYATEAHPLLNPDNLSIYSNPTTGSFNVKFNLPDAGDVKIIITDLNGKEVYQESINNFSGAYDKTISLGDGAAKGTYFVKVSQGGYSSTKTVVLQ